VSGSLKLLRCGGGFGMVIILFSVIVGAQSWWPPKPLPGYNIFTEKQEVWLGEIGVEIEGFDSYVVKDAEAARFLQSLGDRLAQQSQRSKLRYQFFLLDDDEINAYALPGGLIYINRGLMSERSRIGLCGGTRNRSRRSPPASQNLVPVANLGPWR
jgi:Zn-dependent protease with chaperone function